MFRTPQSQTICLAIMAFFIVHSDLFAQSPTVFTVYDATELQNAITYANANPTEVIEIIIDARNTGGVLTLTSTPVLTGANISDSPLCTIKALEGTTVVIDGAGQYGIAIENNVNAKQTLSFDGVTFRNSMGLQKVNTNTTAVKTYLRSSDNTFSGQNLVFSDNKGSVLYNSDETYSVVMNGNIGFAEDGTRFVNQGNVVFQNNESSSGGAAINNDFRYDNADASGSVSKYAFNNTGNVVFQQNSGISGSNGGAINNDADGNSITTQFMYNNLGDVLYLGNTAEGFGGSIYNHTSHTSSTALYYYKNQGNVLFGDNYADMSGGAVYNKSGGPVKDKVGGEDTFEFMNLGNVSFFNNIARESGGAFYNTVDAVPDGITNYNVAQVNLYFKNIGNVDFFQNKALTKNGGVFANVSEGTKNFVTINFSNEGDVFFTDNYAAQDGGALYFEPQSLPDYKSAFYLLNTGNTVFSGNIAGNNGGVISSSAVDYYFGTPTGKYSDNIGNVLFENNLAGGYGGAIHLHDNNLTGHTSTVRFVPTSGHVMEFKNNWHGVDIANADFSQARSNAIYMTGKGNTLELMPKEDASILFRDPIQTVTAAQGDNAINMTGLGTVRLWNGVDNAGSTEYGNIAPAILGGTVTLDSGRFLAMDNAVYGRDASTNLYFTVQNNAALGVSVDQQGGHSVIDANTFTFNDSPDLYVSGVSSLYESQPRVYDGVINSAAAIDGTGNINTTLIDNQYMKAYLDKVSNYKVNLVVERVNNMSTIYGDSAGFLDQIRTSPYLPENLRWRFDDLYNYGEAIDDEFVDLFKTISGAPLLNSFNALKLHGSLFHQKMLSRLTDVDIRAGRYTPTDGQYLVRCGRQVNANNLWGDFTYNHTKQSTGELFGTGYSYKPLLFTFGRDWYHGNWKTGYAFEYAHGKTYSGEKSYTNTQLDTAAGGVYVGRNFGKTYFKGTAQVGIGWNKTDTYYASEEARAKASFNSAFLGTGFELGRVIRFGCVTHPWELTPHVGVEYLFVHGERFSESGGGYLNRSFGQVNYNTVELPFGLRFSKQFHLENGLFSLIHPNVNVMYVRSVGDRLPKAQVSFMDAPLCVWDGHGLPLGRDAFRMNAGVTAGMIGDWDLNFNYGLEARNNYTSQQFSMTIGKSW